MGLWASGVAAALSTLRSWVQLPPVPSRYLIWIGSSIVQSVCLLSRKLWVKVPPDPPKSYPRCPVECDNCVCCQATVAAVGCRLTGAKYDLVRLRSSGVEHLPHKKKVSGSIPLAAIFEMLIFDEG